jgi:hypothetical protein
LGELDVFGAFVDLSRDLLSVGVDLLSAGADLSRLLERDLVLLSMLSSDLLLL